MLLKSCSHFQFLHVSCVFVLTKLVIFSWTFPLPLSQISPLYNSELRKELTWKWNETACHGTKNWIQSLEHLQARLTLTSARRGDLSITLTSPMGTTSNLLTIRYTINEHQQQTTCIIMGRLIGELFIFLLGTFSDVQIQAL